MLRRLGTDVALALVLTVLVLGETIGSDVDVPLGRAIPAGLAMTLPLAWRRRAPLPVAALVMAGLLAMAIGDPRQPPQITLLAIAVAVYSVAAHAPAQVARIGAAICLGSIFAQEPEDFIVLGPLFTGVWFVGRLVRRREHEAAAHARRTIELERERAEAERLAIAEERARIARELHDVVAHSVSVMVVQAGAERLALGDERPETSAVLTEIERTGRQALAEMRRLLGMLRRDDEEIALAPQPSLARLHELAEHMSRAGLPVEVEVEGEAVVLPPGIDISGYRIVQEALTNALKHAGPARARVRLTYGEQDVEIEVADDGAGQPANGSGHGLAGMRERVELYGGDLEAGAREGGGWVLRTRLPLERDAT